MLINSTEELIDRKMYTYPNPAGDYLNVKCSEKDLIIVSDMNGKVLFRDVRLTSEYQIDTHDLMAGLYLVRCIGKDIKISHFVVVH